MRCVTKVFKFSIGLFHLVNATTHRDLCLVRVCCITKVLNFQLVYLEL